MRTLTHAEARRVYDRIGRAQDTQGVLYEDRAVARMLAHGDLGAARSVLEVGCGTGRLARRLLAEELTGDARYLGLDLSPRMVALTRRRVAPFSERADVRLVEGGADWGVPEGDHDRVIATYVLDLLSEDDVRAVLAAAHRALRPGGLLCVTGLAHGRTLPERCVEAVLVRVHRLSPALLGGCRPLDVAALLAPQRWNVVHEETVSALVVRSEVLIASRA